MFKINQMSIINLLISGDRGNITKVLTRLSEDREITFRKSENVPVYREKVCILTAGCEKCTSFLNMQDYSPYIIIVNEFLKVLVLISPPTNQCVSCFYRGVNH